MDTKEKETLGRLVSVLTEVRKEDPEMPAQSMMVLCLTALKPGITMNEVREQLDVHGSTVTRIVDRLSKRKRYNVPGLDLIMRDRSEVDARLVGLYLTPKGTNFVRRLATASR